MDSIASLALTLLVPTLRQGAAEPPLPALEVGSSVHGRFSDDLPVVETPGGPGTTRGMTYRLRVPASGRFTVSLHAALDDGYLVVLDPSGEVLAKNDDGGYGIHARLVIDLAAASEVMIAACARQGLGGDYELCVAAGDAAEGNDVEERARADLTALSAAMESLDGAGRLEAERLLLAHSFRAPKPSSDGSLSSCAASPRARPASRRCATRCRTGRRSSCSSPAQSMCPPSSRTASPAGAVRSRSHGSPPS